MKHLSFIVLSNELRNVMLSSYSQIWHIVPFWIRHKITILPPVSNQITLKFTSFFFFFFKHQLSDRSWDSLLTHIWIRCCLCPWAAQSQQDHDFVLACDDLPEEIPSLRSFISPSLIVATEAPSSCHQLPIILLPESFKGRISIFLSKHHIALQSTFHLPYV